MSFDPERILNDPRWEESKSDPERFKVGRERLFSAFLQSDPKKSEYYNSVGLIEQGRLREEFHTRTLNKYPDQYGISEESLIPPAVSEEEQFAAYKKAIEEHETFLRDSRDALKDLGGMEITDPGLQEAVDKSIGVKEANLKGPGFQAENPLTDQFDAEKEARTQSRVEDFSEGRSPVERMIDNAYVHSLPGKLAQLTLKKGKELVGSESVSLGDMAKEASKRGLNTGDSAAGRWMNTVFAPILADLPVFMMGKKLPAYVLLPAMDFASQGIDILQDDRSKFDGKQLLHAGTIGAVLRFGPTPQWTRSMQGGVIKRMSQHVAGTAVKAGEATLTDPLFGNELTAENFASTFALFLAMESHRLVRAGAAGALDGRLRRMGLTPEEAKFFTNQAMQTQGKPAKLAETYENLTKNSWIEVSPPKGVKGKPVKIDRLEQWAQSYLKLAREKAFRPAEPASKRGLSDPIDRAKPASPKGDPSGNPVFRKEPRVPKEAREWVVGPDGTTAERWWVERAKKPSATQTDWVAEARTPEGRQYLDTLVNSGRRGGVPDSNLGKAVRASNSGIPLGLEHRVHIDNALSPAMYRRDQGDSSEVFMDPEAPSGRQPTEKQDKGSVVPPEGTAGRAPAPEGLAEPQLPAADDRFHSVLPLEMPEITLLARNLMGGSHPKIRERLGNALGTFRGGESRGDAEIELRADIFQVLTPNEKSAIREDAVNEIARQKVSGSWSGFSSVDDKRQFVNENRDDISKRYEVLKREAENRVKLERSSPMARKTLLHEIGHLQDWLPDFKVRGRGNVLGHIGALRGHFMSMMNEVPGSTEAVFSKKERAAFRRKAEKKVGISSLGKKELADEVSSTYQAMLSKAAKDRGLVLLSELKPELFELHKWYRGVSEVSEYFKQPHELYADSFSAIINNPGAVQRRAPLFWNLFWNYQNARPEAAKAYNDLQDAMKAGTVHRDLNLDLRKTMQKGDLDALHDQAGQGHRTRSEYFDSLIYKVFRRTGPIYRRLRVEKVPERKGKVVKALNDFVYRGAEHELYMTHVNNLVLGRLAENNIDWVDFGVFLFHQRVVHERFNIGNPYGFDAKSSAASLREMRNTLGDSRYKALAESGKAFRDLFDEHVIKLLDKFEIFDSELQRHVSDNVYYATFAANKGEDARDYSVEAALSKRYGSSTTGHIYKQIGNLGTIANPATATVSKALSLISMAHREHSKRMAVEWLVESPFSDELVESRTTFNGTARVPAVRDDGRVKTLMYLHRGDVVAYDMPRSLADSLQRGDPVENDLIAKAARMMTRPIKNVYTGVNYGFYPVQFRRDLIDVARKMPKASLWGGRGVLKYVRRSWKDARSTITGDLTPGGERALNRKFLISVAENRGINDSDEAFEQLLVRYHRTPLTWKQGNIRPVSGLRRAVQQYMDVGQSLERTVKIMGMHYLDEHFPDMPEWQKQDMIIHQAGSPNFKESAGLGVYLDVFGLFYNPWKEGVFSEAKAFKQSPAEHFWKTIKYSILPKAAMVAMGAGLLGRPMKEMLDAVPEYDKTNYLVVPLAWYDKDQSKVAYVRLPLSEYVRFIGGMFWKGTHDLRDEQAQPLSQGLFAYAGGQLPTGNPVAHVGAAWMNYKLFGQNTFDDFTGGMILDRDTFNAQDRRTDAALAKWSYNQLSGNLFGRFRNQRINQPEPGRMEKFLRAPVVSNTLGRWFKISNHGVFDRYRGVLDEGVKLDARESLDAKDAVEAIMAGKEVDKPVPPNMLPGLKQRVKKATISRTSPEMQILQGAPSQRQKMMVLEEMNRYNQER